MLGDLDGQGSDAVANPLHHVDRLTRVRASEQVLQVVDYAYLLEVGAIRSSGPAAELLGSQSLRRAYIGV